jgi:hypothetical protein
MSAIQLGSLVIAKRDTGICAAGERGVCYEIYRLDKRVGYSFIFERGGYDGFSPDEVELMLDVTGEICPPVADYHFTNVLRLQKDFHEGRFADAFESAAVE